jgi:hypothetical protein
MISWIFNTKSVKMKHFVITLILFSSVFLNAQVKKDEPFETLFYNMGFSATHSVQQHKDGSIWLMFQNLEYKQISDLEFLKIGVDIDEAILTYQEMLNSLGLEKGTYILTSGLEVNKSGNTLLVRSGDKPTDGWTMINKAQCKKAIKKLTELK